MGHGSFPKCGGTNRQGLPCGNPAGKGTDHLGSGNCKNHGGCTPAGRTHALTEQVERLLYKHDAPPVANPLEALQLLAGRALALEQMIGEKVNELRSIRYETETGGEQLRSEVAVLERAMDRCGRLLVDIAKLNIEERLARVTEIQVAMVQEALRAQLAETSLAQADQRDVITGVGRRLRAV